LKRKHKVNPFLAKRGLVSIVTVTEFFKFIYCKIGAFEMHPQLAYVTADGHLIRLTWFITIRTWIVK